MSELRVSVDRLREAFEYDAATGVLRWKISRRGQAKPGDIAGHSNRGYWSVKIDQQMVMVHRVGWALTHGRWPMGDIDHIDGDPSNNRLENLREGSRGQNMQNRRAPQSNNRSGFLGVIRLNKNLTKPFLAAVRTNRKVVWSERFATAEEAAGAYLRMKAQLHPFNTLQPKAAGSGR